MKLDSESRKARSLFGDYLRCARLKMGLSQSDLAYVLGVSFGTPWYWEAGNAFPKSIVILKRMAVAIPGIDMELKRILGSRGVRPSDSRWEDFFDSLNRPNQQKDKRKVGAGDETTEPFRPGVCDVSSRHKRAFGSYLATCRAVRGIPRPVLADALGVHRNACAKWEAGNAFPRCVSVLGYLERLYGGVVDAAFGTCAVTGFKLTPGEMRDIKCRMGQVGGGLWTLGKPKPEAWATYVTGYREKLKLQRAKRRVK